MCPIGGDVLVVGMGSLGGRRARLRLRRRRHVRAPAAPGSAEKDVQARATPSSRSCAVCSPAPDPTRRSASTPDLRPEGKNGPLVRSLDSYRTYYERWALTWEFQALLRASPGRRPAGRSRDDFLALIDPLRWAEGGSTPPRCVRSARSRPGWRPSGCPAAPTPARTSSWAAAGSPTSSGPCSCSSSSTPTSSPPCGSPARWPPSRRSVRSAGLGRGRACAARGVALRLAHAQRRCALARSTDRQRADRPARRRGHRPDHGATGR